MSSLPGGTEADDDEPAGGSAPPAGAARAERDDVEADTANDARRREELDGNLMKNILGGGERSKVLVKSDQWSRNRDWGMAFEVIHCEL